MEVESEVARRDVRVIAVAMKLEPPVVDPYASAVELGLREREPRARGALVIDTRSAAEYAEGFLPGTLNLPLTNAFVTWAGWLVPYTEDFYLLLSEGAESRLDEIVRSLALIGLDRVGGYWDEAVIDEWAAAMHEVVRSAQFINGPDVALFEDVMGVDPSSMQDINAWTATVAGLVEVKFLPRRGLPRRGQDRAVHLAGHRSTRDPYAEGTW